MSTLISTALFLLSVYILGFLAAIPIGASQIEVARRSLNGLLVSALFVVAGSASSDFVYGAIALYGLAPFLQQPNVEAVFGLINAALILFFAIGMLRESKRAISGTSPEISNAIEPIARSSRLANLRIAYFTGFSLAFTNPLMIAWWLLAARFLKDVGVALELTNTTRIFFLIAGCLGIASYLSLFAIIIHRRHSSFSSKYTRKITRAFGIIMILFVIYFVVHSITILVSPESLKNNLLGSLFGIFSIFHNTSLLYLPGTGLVSVYL